MTKEISSPALLYGIPPALMQEVFPFHLAFDCKGQIVQHGEKMSRLVPSLACGASVQDLFQVVTPTGLLMNFDSIASQLFSVFFVECLQTRHIIKGQMLVWNRPEGDLMLFLCSPFVSDVQGVKGLGLSFNDFALHDSTVDFLFLIEAKARMMQDLRNLAERLKLEVQVRYEAEQALQVMNEKLEQRVSERTTELAVQKNRAEVANKAKSSFLSNMSHELRTPLNAILGYTQILQTDQNLNQRQLAGLHTIYESGEHLLTIINDLLDLGKIEAGKFELNVRTFNLCGFLQAITKMISVRAQQKYLIFTVEMAPDLPQKVRLDELRLRQILLNLLSNAIKFTEKGQVTLRVGSEPFARGQARLRFEVQDSGIGIHSDQLEAIFRPFEQVAATQNQFGGTGLGLSISTQLIHMMKSTIYVESKVGEGSIFWFELIADVTDSERDKVLIPEPFGGELSLVPQECMTIPPPDEIEKLYQLALVGNIRKINQYAKKLMELDPRYSGFVEKLCFLAKDYQTKAILKLIEQHLSGKEST
ncbi:ATP-binding protein [Glaciimonas sp. Gout2]|uniref:ATP-binding protein n=1 Tax=unclassified Glaciimonas TaxID=2644401 RepID=UPI002B235552|nr:MULTISPECIES: ATP-binding protein [unclassified Glaciimonas]MEB0012810.1 ATP-binding protein [Glaciimonas sp. Cout2]MEB0082288.1 ATP-binding protein [Glaciimonas sp. Gout2]